MDVYLRLNDHTARGTDLCLKVYGGSTLFEQFDEDVQDQIKQSLGQLIGTLFQANQLLEHRYGSSSSSVSQGHQRSSSPSPASISGLSVTSTLYDQSSSVAAAAAQRRFSRSPFLLIRWSLRDKKHTENLLQEYSDLNGRIHEQIKLICLGSSIGLDLRHLHHLKTDDNSRKLGFDIDATLKLSIGESNIDATSLELTSPRWTDLLSAATSGQGSFMVLKDNDTFVLQESRFYAPLPQQTHDIDPRTRDRVEALARLLRQQKEQVFRIPRCIGWKFVPSLKHIAFLFEIPQGVTPKPVSLLQLLGDVDVKLSLGSKFHLALGLAKCMAQLHMVRWVSIVFPTVRINIPMTESTSLFKLKIAEDSYRFMRALEARTFFSTLKRHHLDSILHQIASKLITANHGCLVLSIAVLSSTFHLASSIFALLATFIATRIDKVSHKSSSTSFMISMHWVLCSLK